MVAIEFVGLEKLNSKLGSTPEVVEMKEFGRERAGLSSIFMLSVRKGAAWLGVDRPLRSWYACRFS